MERFKYLLLNGGVAVINVGETTAVEMKEKKRELIHNTVIIESPEEGVEGAHFGNGVYVLSPTEDALIGAQRLLGLVKLRKPSHPGSHETYVHYDYNLSHPVTPNGSVVRFRVTRGLFPWKN